MDCRIESDNDTEAGDDDTGGCDNSAKIHGFCTAAREIIIPETSGQVESA